VGLALWRFGGRIVAERVNRWLKVQDLIAIDAGEVSGMGEVDLAAICEGQALTKIRQYSRKVRHWDLRGLTVYDMRR
jgi:hypothetical protein